MRKYLLIGLVLVFLLAALFLSQYFFSRRANRKAVSITPVVTTPPVPTAPAGTIPIAKGGNREVIIGPQNSRIIVSINGLLTKISLEGVNENGTSGQVAVDATYNDQPIHFFGVLPDVALIDDREGKYRTMSLFEFTSTSPKPDLFVGCRPADQTQTENFRCLALIFRTGF